MAMRLIVPLATAFVLTGCGAYYEDVPAFGQTDPNYVAAAEQGQQRPLPQQGTVAAIGYDNQAQGAVDPGQAVNADAQQDYSDTDPSALTEFKSTLDPYGTWADDAQYGTVWQPDPGVVGSDFAPYVTGGHWAYDDDYVWQSDYDWGWAPFHYGRWTYIAGRGWCWIPGRRYAGAWVSWRTGVDGYGYVGWGPMAPSWYWRDGLAYNVGWGVSTPYTFCRNGDLFSPSLHGRLLAGPEVATVANNTHVYTGDRTAAHPTVGPPPNHLGVTPPAWERSPGYLRARALATQPGNPTGGMARPPQQVPYYPPRGVVGSNRPVATAPHYVGVPPQPYRGGPGPVYRSYAPPARSFGTAPPVYRGGGYGGGYGGGAPPVYHGAPPTMSRGYGGGGGFNGGGGYHPPSTSTYTHSHSSSFSHGGGGGRGGHR
jgi:hypothetical protein